MLQHPLDTVERRISAIASELGASAPGLAAAVRASLGEGKRVRPRLVIDLHAAYGNPDPESATRLAVAMELWHGALTAHDDVLDGDELRRGHETAVGMGRRLYEAPAQHTPHAQDREPARLLGDTLGLLAGDLLLSAAMLEIADLDVPLATRRRLTAMLRESMGTTA